MASRPPEGLLMRNPMLCNEMPPNRQNSRGGARTLDLTIMSRALLPAELPCPKRHSNVMHSDENGRPKRTGRVRMAGAGFEPATFGL